MTGSNSNPDSNARPTDTLPRAVSLSGGKESNPPAKLRLHRTVYVGCKLQHTYSDQISYLHLTMHKQP